MDSIGFPFWLGVTPTTGTGPGTVSVSVRENEGRNRRCVLTISGTVDGETVTSTALVEQAGNYKDILTDKVKITSEGVEIPTTITSISGTTAFTISDKTWKNSDNFTFEIETNAAAYNVKIIPSTEAVVFLTGNKANNKITYINNEGVSTTASLALTSSTTSFDTRSVLPTGFDPGINGTYTLTFSVQPNERYTNTSKDTFCGVSLYASETLNTVSSTLVAQMGTIYPGVTGITPSFPNGESSVALGPTSTSTTLDIDCADTTTWSIS